MEPSKDYKIVKSNDVIHLADLLLRWAYHPHFKIYTETTRNNLNPYLIVKDSINKNGEISYKILKEPLTHMTHKHMCSFFSSIVFLKRKIESIESKKPYYTERPVSKKYKEFELCTLENINRYAPQFAFTILKSIKNTDIKLYEFEIEQEIHSKTIDHFDDLVECLDQNRRSWVLPNDKIWPITSSYFSRKPQRKERDLSEVTQFCEDQKSKGITDNKVLARLVDEFFTTPRLTNAEMGNLLPANPGTKVSIFAKQKQGKKLRGII